LDIKSNSDAIAQMFNQPIQGKVLNKKNYKMAINLIMNKMNEMKEKQRELEINSNFVADQNKELLMQNEYLLKEIRSKM